MRPELHLCHSLGTIGIAGYSPRYLLTEFLIELWGLDLHQLRV
jgi:hypothetical protein